jgi:ribosomal protein L7/L12
MFPVHPAEREAERLRTIITTLAEVEPGMELGIAKDVIFKIEEETCKLEKQQVEVSGLFMLPDDAPRTIAAFIELQPDIAALCEDKKINAIKEVRARAGANGTHIGLKEAKEGVEFYSASKHRSAGTPAPTTATGWCIDNTPQAICDWIEDYGHTVRDEYDSKAGVSGHGKIQAIKEVRALCPSGPSLYEAKIGFEKWVATYR